MENKENPSKSSGFYYYSDGNAVPKCIAKPLLYAVFWVVFSVLCPIRGFLLPPAMAATTVVTEVTRKSKSSSAKEELNKNDHEYSHCTKSLLETVSGLITKIEEVKNGKNVVSSVEEALKEVKIKRKELQDVIMMGLYAKLRMLREEKKVLLKRSEEILGGVLKANREEERLRRKATGGQGEGVKDKIVKLEEEMRNCEREYSEIWDRIGEIDDQILRRETVALSIGVRELLFIERECEQLVEGFLRKMRRSNTER